MNQACAAVGNRDIEKFVPALITAMANPTEVPETVHKLSATTFVQAVEAPALSIMVPLLVRGLRERQTAIKRKSAVIIDNMSKLVDNPADAAVFLPRWVLQVVYPAGVMTLFGLNLLFILSLQLPANQRRHHGAVDQTAHSCDASDVDGSGSWVFFTSNLLM